MGIACIKTLARTRHHCSVLRSPDAPPCPLHPALPPGWDHSRALTWRTVLTGGLEPDLAVFTRSGQQAAVGVEGHGEDHVLVTVNCLHGAHDYRLLESQVPDHHLHSREPALNSSPAPSPIPVPTVTRQPGCRETWYPRREATDGSLAKRPRGERMDLPTEVATWQGGEVSSQAV